MKRLSLILGAAAVALSSLAQSEAPNRLIVTNTAGSRAGYVLDRVQDLTFAKVDGVAEAKVKVIDVSTDKLVVDITRSTECVSYRLDVVPGTLVNTLSENPLYAISYFNQKGITTTYDQDFVAGDLTGIELNSGSDYAVVTIGIDKYGVEDGVSIAPFKTPAAPVAGNPKVEAEVVSTTTRSFTITFTPNADVSCYYTVAGEKGSMMEQYEQFGPMFGFSSINDMLMSWGLKNEGVQTKEWKNMDPGDYEVYILPLDVNGNPAEYQVFNVSTQTLGGTGEAKVEVELDMYELADWNGVMKYSQYISFTPNDQTAAYRIGVYKQAEYDPKKDEILDELRSDPPMPMAYWFFYEEMTTDFQIDPGTPCVAVACGKNLNNEWGPVTEVRFTPTVENGISVPAGNGKVIARPRGVIPAFEPGKLPVVRKAAPVLR